MPEVARTTLKYTKIYEIQGDDGAARDALVAAKHAYKRAVPDFDEANELKEEAVDRLVGFYSK
jgi:hypothetical protein